MIDKTRRKLYFFNYLKKFKRKRGATIEDLEDLINQKFNTKEAIVTSSGREAIILLFYLLKIKKKDEIILPRYFCKNVADLISKHMTIKYVDVDETLNYNMKELKKAITNKTKIILAVHMYGFPCNLEGIKKISKQAYVIEDCAHALGAKYKNKYVGSIGDASIISFSKLFAIKRGGALVINDKKLITTSKKIKLKEKRTKTPKKYKILKLNPIKASMSLYLDKKFSNRKKFFYSGFSDFEAEILFNQLKNIDKINKETIKKAETLIKKVKYKTQKKIKNTKPIYTRVAFHIQNEKKRNRLLKDLTSEGFHTTMLYKEIKTKPFKYNDYLEKHLLPIYLPINLTNEDINFLAEKIK